MEELDLKELLRYYLKKLPIILIITAIFTIAGYVYTEYIQIPMYEGVTTIILVEENDKENITQDEITVNEKLVTTYSHIIKSRRVLEQVKEELKLDRSIYDLSEQIYVSAIEETSIIKITVTDTNNKLASKIANKVAEIFKEEITEIYNLKNISTIDEAIVEKYPYNVSEVKQIIIFAIGGIGISCALIFIMYYFDNSIKNKKEIEEKLNIPVIGEIPIATKLDKKKKRRKSKKKPLTSTKKEEKIIETKETTKKKTNEKSKEVKKTPTKKVASKTTETKTTAKKATSSSPKKETTKKTTTSNKTKKKTTKGGEE